MPPLMSFSATTPQMRARAKTVTRRLGWIKLKPGDIVWAVEKAMGLGKGGKVVRIGLIRIVDVRMEPLLAITPEDVAAEGFPDMSRGEFIALFCRINACLPTTMVRRIQFEYLDP